MKLPKAKNLNSEKYVAGLSLFKQKFAKIKLSANESALGPSPKAVKEYIKVSKNFKRYPDSEGTFLRETIARKFKLDQSRIIIGNGSDQVLELICKAFLNKNDEVIVSKYSFIIYRIYSKLNSAKIIYAPENNFTSSVINILSRVTRKTKIIFIANPNNPTGTYLTHYEIDKFLQKVSSDIIIVLDLAYYEYVTTDDYINTLEILNNYKNVLITKSFSKIHGLSALRVGYGMGDKKLIEIMNRVRQPFNVNSIAQKAAIASLDDANYLQKSIEYNTKEREFLYKCLKEMSINYIPSQGNFICIDVNQSGRKIFELLLKKGVIVRPIELYEMPNFIRVTIGQRSENEFFIQKLKECL